MGRFSSEKGKRYERWLADQLRKRWPRATVRRSSQADRAHAPDVVVTNDAPTLVRRVWWECNDARVPAPREKLAQAERDVLEAHAPTFEWLPVVVWHRTGERTHWATTRLGTLDELRWLAGDKLYAPGLVLVRGEVVTLELHEFLGLLGGEP